MKKIAIIGASSGLGFKVAEEFASMGWRVAVAARRKEPLQRLQKRFPDNVVWETIDVTRDDAVERFYRLIERNNGIDTLLIAAGTGFTNPTLEPAKEVTTLQTNVTGFARIAAAAYRYFAATRNNAPGRIAAITSVAGTKGIGVAASYSASKRFQRTYLDALEQLAHRRGDNIRFTDIRPGFIRTPLLDPDKDYPLIMSEEYAVPLIVHAILAGRRVATVDWRWRLITALWSTIPRAAWVRMPIGI